MLDAELSVLENARKDDSSLPALEKVASNASQQYKRSRPSASKKAAQGAKLLRTSEPHPLFNTGSSDALRRAISGYRPPQSILELKSKDETLGAAAKDFRAKIDRKKALEERHTAASRGLSAALRHRCDSPPSDEAVGGLIFDFERISGEIATRYISHAGACKPPRPPPRPPPRHPRTTTTTRRRRRPSRRRRPHYQKGSAASRRPSDER